MDNYDISVIIPVYNTEKYLPECIESVLNQTKDRIQIVMVDDQSTDGSFDVIKRYAENHSNILPLKNPVKGVINARILGLRSASGKYIGWVDSDDYIDRSMYEKLFDLAEGNRADVVYCDTLFVPAAVNGKGKWFKEFRGKKDWHFLERNTQCTNKLFLRSYAEKVELERLYQVLDEYGNLALLLNTDKIAFTREELYCYRVGIQSVSGGSFKGKTSRFVHFAECSSHLAEELSNGDEELEEYLTYKSIYSRLQVLIVASVNGEKDTYNKFRNQLKQMNFKKNSLVKQILDENHGRLKSFVLRNVVTSCYTVARIVTAIVYR